MESAWALFFYLARLVSSRLTWRSSCWPATDYGQIAANSKITVWWLIHDLGLATCQTLVELIYRSNSSLAVVASSVPYSRLSYGSKMASIPP